MDIYWGEKEFLLFRYLLKNPSIDLKEAEKNLPLSHMTIRAGVENINDFLQKNGKKQIIIKKGQIIFPLDSLGNFTTDCHFFSTNIERFDYLLIKFLFEKEVVLSKEIEILKVSRTTLEGIMAKITNFVAQYNLTIDSQLWSGFSLQGKIEDKIMLATELVASLYTFKELNPNFYKIFNIENSNIVYKELQKSISEESRESAEKLTKEIFRSFQYEDNLYFYHLAVAYRLVLSIYRDELKNEAQHFNYEFYSGNLSNILEKYLEIKFIKDQTMQCLEELQKDFQIDITPELLKKSERYFYIAKYKKRFNLETYDVKLDLLPITFREILEKIKPVIFKCFDSIFDEDLLMIMFELKDIFFTSNNTGKRILLIDSTNSSSIFGEIIKNRLEKNYNVKTVDSASIFSIDNWNSLAENYDMIFFLNHYTLNIFKEKEYDIKIPYHVISGGDFIKDLYFFKNFDIELKNGIL